jgi:hypothetical protein
MMMIIATEMIIVSVIEDHQEGITAMDIRRGGKSSLKKDPAQNKYFIFQTPQSLKIQVS